MPRGRSCVSYGYLIVFDPKNFEKNTEQVHALFEQIERESTQIELQEMELAHQTITLATDLRTIAHELNTQVGTSFTGSSLHEPQVQAELERRYPIDPPRPRTRLASEADAGLGRDRASAFG